MIKLLTAPPAERYSFSDYQRGVRNVCSCSCICISPSKPWELNNTHNPWLAGGTDVGTDVLSLPNSTTTSRVELVSVDAGLDSGREETTAIASFVS